MEDTDLTINDQLTTEKIERKSTQCILPVRLAEASADRGEYNIYPVCSVGVNQIFNGFESLAAWIAQQKTVAIDGYAGVFWNKIQAFLTQYFASEGITINWIKTSDYLRPAKVIDEFVRPFMGSGDSVWGTKTTLMLQDIYDTPGLRALKPDDSFTINILAGTGAALAEWDVPLIYIDLPKNELQFRMRAGSITNLGTDKVYDHFYMYKRFYFVDWVMLNAHKKAILERIDVIADGQWPDDINWMMKKSLVEGLDKISQSVIRVRPWFEPGAWGGQWIKDHIKNLNTDVVNYAWSFELIVPENGLIFESNGYLLEVSFDFLMFHSQKEVLGRHAEKFGDEFPIRFDFLDTYDGGNLSIQCHPRLKYIRDMFGENITQDETYYILDCKDDAQVYLGFQQNIEPEKFRAVLENSQAENKPVEITDYVQSHRAKKHDLFLIPNGTVHSAGADNLVLEISATPYIFTFKMYDWLRLDLDGKPRPINIEHAFNNLYFERKGKAVEDELIVKPKVLETGNGYQVIHLPTHAEHFYDVHRMEFTNSVNIENHDCCHVLMLVEGKSVIVETANGTKQTYHFAETFVIPAAAKSYTLTNLGNDTAKVIKAFLK